MRLTRADATRHVDTFFCWQHTSSVSRSPFALIHTRQLGVLFAAGACSSSPSPSGLDDTPVQSAQGSGTPVPDAGTSPMSSADSQPEPEMPSFVRFEIAVWNDGATSMALLTDATYCDPFQLIVSGVGNIAPSNAKPTPVSDECCADHVPGLVFTEVTPRTSHTFVVEVGGDTWVQLLSSAEQPIDFRFGVERAACLAGSCDNEFYSSDSPELCPQALHASRWQPLTLSEEATRDLLAADPLPVVLPFDVHTSSDD